MVCFLFLLDDYWWSCGEVFRVWWRESGEEGLGDQGAKGSENKGGLGVEGGSWNVVYGLGNFLGRFGLFSLSIGDFHCSLWRVRRKVTQNGRKGSERLEKK